MADPVSVVTGAGSGIGRAVARGLAARGHRLMLVGRREELLEETARELDVETICMACDVTDRDAPATIINSAMAHWDRIDGLVNNAGVAPLVPIYLTEIEDLERAFAVNVYAPALLIARAWPYLVEQGGGVIVNVSSRATVDPFPGFFVYAATKAAVESMVRSVRNEGGEQGIRAYAVAPGAVETPMLRGLFGEEVIPASETMAPEDVARVIVGCVVGEAQEDAVILL